MSVWFCIISFFDISLLKIYYKPWNLFTYNCTYHNRCIYKFVNFTNFIYDFYYEKEEEVNSVNHIINILKYREIIMLQYGRITSKDKGAILQYITMTIAVRQSQTSSIGRTNAGTSTSISCNKMYCCITPCSVHRYHRRNFY